MNENEIGKWGVDLCMSFNNSNLMDGVNSQCGIYMFLYMDIGYK